jgi:cytochrome c peroxidase
LRRARLSYFKAATTVLCLSGGVAVADETSLSAAANAACPGYTVCPEVKSDKLFSSADARSVLNGIAAGEADSLNKLENFSSLNNADKRILLGAAILFDNNLSVHQNQTCDFCHIRATGFTGGMSAINKNIAAYFGSQGSPRLDGSPTSGSRAGNRRPITYAYMVFGPVLDLVNGDLVGGTFWDMRATGFVTGHPAIDQALGPYLNPLEQALPDPGCVVRTVSRSKYAAEFKSFWGRNSFDITWPLNTDQLCARPNSTHAANPQVLGLSAEDREQVNTTFQNVAASVASLERSKVVSPFSSKYDHLLCGNATLTASETRGLNVFLGKGKCASCHTAVTPNPPATCGANPLFTNFKASNIGVPRNPDIPFLTENGVDKFGYKANPAGLSFVDNGVGDMLRALDAEHPNNPVAAADPNQFDGKFQVPTVRNLTSTPRSGFLRVFGHNGEFQTIRQVVDFHATRDVLDRCPDSDPNQPGFGTSCWPKPEQPKNLETKLVGNLGLSAGDETDLVAFLGTLNDATFGPLP